MYKAGITPLMKIEMTLMTMELVYMWRAMPFCSEQTKLTMLDALAEATSPDGLPFHHALRDLLTGCVLMSLNRVEEAEKVLYMYVCLFVCAD